MDFFNKPAFCNYEGGFQNIYYQPCSVMDYIGSYLLQILFLIFVILCFTGLIWLCIYLYKEYKIAEEIRLFEEKECKKREEWYRNQLYEVLNLQDKTFKNLKKVKRK